MSLISVNMLRLVSPAASWNAAVGCTGCGLCGSRHCTLRVAPCSSTAGFYLELAVPHRISSGEHRCQESSLPEEQREANGMGFLFNPSRVFRIMGDGRQSVSRDTGTKMMILNDNRHPLGVQGAVGTSEVTCLGGKADPGSPLPNSPSLASD